MIGVLHVVVMTYAFILHWQGRVVKEWGVLGVSCRGQCKAWSNKILLILLILCL